MPGDCPALDSDALALLLAPPMAPPAVTIVSDRAGTGTNALLLAQPGAIDPAFGPGSFERHRALCERAGASWRSQELAGLLLDIDTPEDLEALRTAHAGAETAAVLATL